MLVQVKEKIPTERKKEVVYEVNDVSSYHHFDVISHHHVDARGQHIFNHQLPTCISSVLADDEGLRERNVLPRFILCYVHCSKVLLTSITLCSNEPLQHYTHMHTNTSNTHIHMNAWHAHTHAHTYTHTHTSMPH